MHTKVFHRRCWFDGLYKFSPGRFCSSGGATATSLVNRLINQFHNRHSFNQATSRPPILITVASETLPPLFDFSRLQIFLEQRLSSRPRFVLQIPIFRRTRADAAGNLAACQATQLSLRDVSEGEPIPDLAVFPAGFRS